MKKTSFQKFLSSLYDDKQAVEEVPYEEESDSEYCECGKTNFTKVVLFNSVVKVCDNCGKDKR